MFEQAPAPEPVKAAGPVAADTSLGDTGSPAAAAAAAASSRFAYDTLNAPPPAASSSSAASSVQRGKDGHLVLGGSNDDFFKVGHGAHACHWGGGACWMPLRAECTHPTGAAAAFRVEYVCKRALAAACRWFAHPSCVFVCRRTPSPPTSKTAAGATAGPVAPLPACPWGGRSRSP